MSNSNAVRSAQSGPFTGRRKSASITPGAMATLVGVAVDFPFAEAAVGDVVSVSFDAPLVAGIIFAGASVAAPGHVSLRFQNGSAGTLTQTAIGTNVQLNKSV